MSELKMFESGLPEWVIAESAEEAIGLYKAYWQERGYDPEEEDLNPEWWDEYPADKDFTFEHLNGSKTTMTAREWCAEHGKGWFATSEYG